jgi:hypothetical protein
MSVKVTESQEFSDIFDCFGFLPVFYTRNFHQVHGDSAIFKNNAQEFDFLGFKGAFSWFEVQVQLL